MRQSRLFYKTLKEAPKKTDALSNILLTRAGFIDQLAAGLYSFLPLGLLVLKKIENIISKEMVDIGGQEILMPALVPKENWKKTGRWDSFKILFKIKAGAQKEYALGPTHEEVVVPLAKKIILSHKDLPFYLFQVQTKFRDELRVKSGLLRTREFLMKDLYSFHGEKSDLDRYYEKVAESYFKIFKKCGVPVFKTLASGGSFSEYSHEYQAVSDSGEDIIHICQKCSAAVNKEIKKDFKKCPECKNSVFKERRAVEVGNIFKLGNKYSLPFDLLFKDAQGKEKPVLMGCYGIGIPRLMAAAVEINHDSKGIVWPKKIAPFLFHLIQIENSRGVVKTTEKIYKKLGNVLYDDRKKTSAGQKFAEADLIGLPYRIVVSERTLKKSSIEIKERKKDRGSLLKIKNLPNFIKKAESVLK